MTATLTGPTSAAMTVDPAGLRAPRQTPAAWVRQAADDSDSSLGPAPMPKITFAPDAWGSQFSILRVLEGWVVDITCRASTLLSGTVMVLGADEQHLTVCPYVDGHADEGRAQQVPYPLIDTITVA